MKDLKIGIVGATGVVGETFQELLNERNIPVSELRLFASEKSKGSQVTFRDKTITLQVLEKNCFNGLDVVFFSSGDDISKEWAPQAAKAGAYAIDNSAAFRMSPDHALVVPEINFADIAKRPGPQVIANPNCSTIQLVMALNALKPFNIQSVRVSSYQAVSGAGRDGIQDLKQQSTEVLNGNTVSEGKVFSPPIAFDCIPQIGSLNESGFCSEEVKIMKETQKILDLPNLDISAFTVRIPTMNGHAESVWVTFDNDIDLESVFQHFEKQEGVQIKKDVNDFYQLKDAIGQDDTLVSKVRISEGNPKTLMMWVIADNLRRGAASNGLFIMEKLFN